MQIITELEFNAKIRDLLLGDDDKPAAYLDRIGSVTGPGRSGAIAAVYASHILGVPFIPFGSKPPVELGQLLIIDTAMQSGKTLRKAQKRYSEFDSMALWCFNEPPRVAFWYEAMKPQKYRHEKNEI